MKSSPSYDILTDMTEEFSNYKEYIKSRKAFIEESIQSVLAAPKEKLKFGRDGVFNDFDDVLSLWISTNVDDRRDQVISLGFDPKRTAYIDFNGSQNIAAFKVVEMLSRMSEDEIRNFASNLLGEFHFD